jgi:hypothetical protein
MKQLYNSSVRIKKMQFAVGLDADPILLLTIKKPGAKLARLFAGATRSGWRFNVG